MGLLSGFRHHVNFLNLVELAAKAGLLTGPGVDDQFQSLQESGSALLHIYTITGVLARLGATPDAKYGPTLGQQVQRGHLFSKADRLV